MQFKELQKDVIKVAEKYSKKNKIKIDKDFALLKLYEEVGELTQDILVAKKKSRPEKFVSAKKSKENIAKEMADVLGILIINAYLWNIDLEQAIKNKWTSKLNKK